MPSWETVCMRDAAQESIGSERALHVVRHVQEVERAYRAGNLLALFEACDVCDHHEAQLPGWIPLAAMDLIAEALDNGLSSGRGRTGHPLAKLQEDLKHFARWDTVQSLIEHRNHGWKDFQNSLRSPKLSPSARKKLLSQAPLNPGENLQETFAAASQALAGTIAFGSPATIQNSYKLFNKAAKSPQTAAAFMTLSRKIYQRFGLDPITTIAVRPRHKSRVRK